ncbi:uncharacterized protein [Watersipora subatra]|uniref:uncharacterized protein n=1 Tax=Watersipora subatra TaxID=2589382 RepID=UPI00355B6E7E
MFQIKLILACLLTVATKYSLSEELVQCAQLSPPQHGSIKATDSNNLYSKITYSCDTGYSLQGPPSRQCLPVPYPDSAVWVPSDITTCVTDVPPEVIDALLIYDPAEDDSSLEEPAEPTHIKDNSLQDEFIINPADDEDATTEIDEFDEADDSFPPSLIQLQEDEEAQVSTDDPCTTSEMPERYWCKDAAPTAVAWTVDTSQNACTRLDLCGEGAEAIARSLFTTHEKCVETCLPSGQPHIL